MSRFPRVVFLGVVALVVLLAAPVRAQDPPREGFWFALGAGAGSANVTCDDCDNDDRETGGAGYLAGGWALNRRVLLGLDLSLWTKTDDADGVDVTVNLYNFTGTVTVYPSATANFFLKAGAGAAFADSEFRVGSTLVSTELGSGVGLMAGAGYDIRLGRRLALTPAISYNYGNINDLTYEDEPIAFGFKQNWVAVTIGLTFP